MTRLVLASLNAHKLDEVRQILDGTGVEVLDLRAFTELGEPPEDGATFAANALQKATYVYERTGLPVVADDSGLEVDALGGAPGVLSARYATLFGGPREDDANNRTLLANMAGRVQRSARFVGVLVALRQADDPEPLVAMGRWQGELLEAPRGQGGFGYDPLLLIPALGRSVAELDAPTKNLHSHRALAAAQMLQLMREVWRV